MNLLFILKLDHPDLAVAEAKASVYGWGWWAHGERHEDGALLLEGRVPKRLGLTRKIVRVLHACPVKDLARAIRAYPWRLRGSYRVSLTDLHGHRLHEREVARLVWEAAKGKVDLHRPMVRVEIVLTRTTAYIGTLAWENTEDFRSRRAHLWPAPHPSALPPTMARALVRLVCAKRIDDPFCGGGGLLFEAGLAGIRASGGDIDPEMVARARKNCRAYGVKASLRVADALAGMPAEPAVVTDLPYGKSTQVSDLDGLRRAFLADARTRRMVVGLPCPWTFPGWAVRAHFSAYVHKGLTRHFYVLERVTRVLAFGTFDGLHPGHEHYLRAAKAHGDHLTVVVARDATVSDVKGRATVRDERARLRAVRALPYVDEARLGYRDDKHRILAELHPDVICLGYDQRSFTRGLRKQGVRVVRIGAFHPETYKSSLMRGRGGTRSPPLRARTRRR